jgi:hypothetical protein
MDPDNVKGLYQRAHAQMGLQKSNLALQDLRRAQLLDPGNEDVADLISKAEKEEEKAICLKMFGNKK